MRSGEADAAGESVVCEDEGRRDEEQHMSGGAKCETVERSPPLSEKKGRAPTRRGIVWGGDGERGDVQKDETERRGGDWLMTHTSSTAGEGAKHEGWVLRGRCCLLAR